MDRTHPAGVLAAGLVPGPLKPALRFAALAGCNLVADRPAPPSADSATPAAILAPVGIMLWFRP
jgi:hypothetical protein